MGKKLLEGNSEYSTEYMPVDLGREIYKYKGFKKDKYEKKELFSSYDELFTKDYLNKLKNKKFISSSIEELFPSKVFKIDDVIFSDYIKNNSDLLDIVVENGLFEGTSSCLDDKFFKNLYFIKKQGKISKILKDFTDKDGNKIDINKIFQSNECEPLNLYKKLKQLKTKDGITLTEKQIKQILDGTLNVKKIKTKDKIEEKLKDKKDIFFTYIRNNQIILLSMNSNEKNNFYKNVLDRLGIKDKKEQKKLIKLVENLEKQNKFLNKIKDIKEVEEVNGGEIDDFDISKLPSGFQTDELGGFYKKVFDEQNNAGVYITNKIFDELTKLGIDRNSWLGRGITNLIKKIDLSKRSTSETSKIIINKLKEYKNIPFLGTKIDKVISFLKKRANNAKETEYFFKNGFIQNTETIWLYSNDPSDLEKYSLGDISKAPLTKGRNQITTKIIFEKIMKECSDFSQINGHGIVDYLLKMKIKYETWDKAIGVIYKNLGKEQFKKFSKFLSSGGNNNEQIKTVLSDFKKDYKDIINKLVNYTDFEDKQNIENDYSFIKETIEKDDEAGLLIVGDKIEDIKKGKILDSKKTSNILTAKLTDAQSTGLLDSSLKGMVGVLLRKPDLLGEVTNNLDSEKAKELKKTLSTVGEGFKTLGIDYSSLSIEAINIFQENIFKNPEKAAYAVVLDMVRNGQLDSEKAPDEIIKLLSKLDSSINKEVYKDFKNILNLAKEGKKNEIKIILDKITSNDLKKEFFIRLSGNNKYIVDLITGKLTIDDFVKKVKSGKIDTRKFNNISTNITNSFSIASKIGMENIKMDKENLVSQIKKRDKDGDQLGDGVNRILENQKKALSKTEKGRKLLEEQARIKMELAKYGFYTEKEKQEVYNEIYYSTYLDNDFKQKIKEQAEKDGVKLENKSNSKYSKEVFEDNISSKIDLNNMEENKDFKISYKENGGLIKIENPFKNNELQENEIIGSNIKDANEKLLLSYLQNLGFYQVDELDFGKDSQKIYDLFNIDITKPLDLQSIKQFSKNFISGTIYKLKNNQNISSIHKKYIKKFEDKLITNPDDFSLYQEFIQFLNDNQNLLIQSGYYDFTEQKFNLSNFIDKNKDKKYRAYLKENNLFEKLI